jgi:hypothetical protein
MFWNFSSEDLIGDAIQLASHTHRLTAADRTLDRYRVRLALVFAGRDQVQTGRPEWLSEEGTAAIRNV